MRKIILYTLVCLSLNILLAGCSSDENSGAMKIMNVEAKDLEAPVYGERDTNTEAAAKGANDFAFRFSAELLKNNKGENFVISPYSVWLPLAALVNATDSGNRDTLLSTLGASGISVEDINNAASRMLYDLTKEQNKEYSEEYNEPFHNPLKIANAIFVDDNATLRPEFAEVFMDFYRGSAMNVDFGSPSAVAAVNQWASDNTDGLITNLIQEFDPHTVSAIANAIYFSDRWHREFNPEQTADDVFHTPSGDLTASYMLREGDMLYYYEDEKVQAMPLRFTTGGEMYIILPKSGGAEDLLADITNEYFEEIQNGSEMATGKLLLPRFSIESGVISLKDALIALGVPLFDQSAAPLTGGLVEEDIPLWLSSALQKAVIKVDEKGTTVAAVTIMSVEGGGAMSEPTEPFKMICDKPFVFVLCAPTYDGGSQILFTGVVNQPE